MIQQKNNLKYITFQNLENTNAVKHCVTTRLGGVSTGIYAELNLSFSRGEAAEKVLQNYDILCNTLKINKNSCATMYIVPIEIVTQLWYYIIVRRDKRRSEKRYGRPRRSGTGSKGHRKVRNP